MTEQQFVAKSRNDVIYTALMRSRTKKVLALLICILLVTVCYEYSDVLEAAFSGDSKDADISKRETTQNIFNTDLKELRADLFQLSKEFPALQQKVTSLRTEMDTLISSDSHIKKDDSAKTASQTAVASQTLAAPAPSHDIRLTRENVLNKANELVLDFTVSSSLHAIKMKDKIKNIALKHNCNLAPFVKYKPIWFFPSELTFSQENSRNLFTFQVND